MLLCVVRSTEERVDWSEVEYIIIGHLCISVCVCVEVNDCVDEYMCYSVNIVLVKMSRTQNRSEAAISKSDVQKRHIWEYIRTHILNT